MEIATVKIKNKNTVKVTYIEWCHYPHCAYPDLQLELRPNKKLLPRCETSSVCENNMIREHLFTFIQQNAFDTALIYNPLNTHTQSIIVCVIIYPFGVIIIYPVRAEPALVPWSGGPQHFFVCSQSAPCREVSMCLPAPEGYSTFETLKIKLTKCTCHFYFYFIFVWMLSFEHF